MWLKVQNKNTYPVGLLSRSMDPEYFSAFEVSYPNHRAFSDDTNRKMDEFFRRSQFPLFVEPGATDSGFVFTSRSEGTKFVNIEFWRRMGLTHDGFFIKLPVGGFDFEETDFSTIYSSESNQAAQPLRTSRSFGKDAMLHDQRLGHEKRRPSQLRAHRR